MKSNYKKIGELIRLVIYEYINRKRPAIVEHPFIIIKRQCNFHYIMTKKSMKIPQLISDICVNNWSSKAMLFSVTRSTIYVEYEYDMDKMS